MSTTLYTEEDSLSLDKEVSAKVTEVKKQQEEQASVDNIRSVLSEVKKELNEKKVYFTCTSKKGTHIKIEDTELGPSKLSLLSGKKFEESYMKELKSLLYSSEENVKVDKLIALMHIYNISISTTKPIIITGLAYKKLLPKICNVLNQFFNKNIVIIGTICKMLNDQYTEFRQHE